MTTQPTVSVVVPVYNEEAGIRAFHESLRTVLDALDTSYEIIYCNDGSADATAEHLATMAAHDTQVRVLTLSRNFGKELAVTAGIAAAVGKAIIMLDGDGQHPVGMIPDFIERWRQGSKVVVGVYTANDHRSWFKQQTSKLFYALFNRLTSAQLIPRSTDFRLIDRVVQQDFVRLTERNRMTRVLIDWLGYTPALVPFEASARLGGEATYSTRQLIKLAIDSMVSVSVSPLYIVAYIGGVVLPLSILLGLLMAFDAVIGDPLGIHATGSAYITVLTLALVGVLMLSQGIIGLYLSHIHAETQGRPLYIIDEAKSIRLS